MSVHIWDLLRALASYPMNSIYGVYYSGWVPQNSRKSIFRHFTTNLEL